MRSCSSPSPTCCSRFEATGPRHTSPAPVTGPPPNCRAPDHGCSRTPESTTPRPRSVRPPRSGWRLGECLSAQPAGAAEKPEKAHRLVGQAHHGVRYRVDEAVTHQPGLALSSKHLLSLTYWNLLSLQKDLHRNVIPSVVDPYAANGIQRRVGQNWKSLIPRGLSTIIHLADRSRPQAHRRSQMLPPRFFRHSGMYFSNQSL